MKEAAGASPSRGKRHLSVLARAGREAALPQQVCGVQVVPDPSGRQQQQLGGRSSYPRQPGGFRAAGHFMSSPLGSHPLQKALWVAALRGSPALRWSLGYSLSPKLPPAPCPRAGGDTGWGSHQRCTRSPLARAPPQELQKTRSKNSSHHRFSAVAEGKAPIFSFALTSQKAPQPLCKPPQKVLARACFTLTIGSIHI